MSPRARKDGDDSPTGRGLRALDWLEQRLNLTEIFSFITHFGLVFTPMDTTRPLLDVAREAADRRVPAYARGPRVLALLASIGFGMQLVTGLLLAVYYRPTPEAAFVSTRAIVRDLPLGWFVHQMHAWGAFLLIGVIVLRLLRLFWESLYTAPREVLWWCGVAMGWLVLQSDFTGRLLTWDTHSYWSTVRGLEVVYALPVLGPLMAFLIGGPVVTEDVLLRFYVLHVLILPALFAACIYLTFATIRRVGLSPSRAAENPRTQTSVQHLYSMMIMNVLVFGVLVTVAVLLPFRFLSAADPYVTPGGIRPPWYMLAPYALLQGAPGPAWLWGFFLLVAAFAVLLIPQWVRPDSRIAKHARLWGMAALSVWIALGVYGAFLDRR
jgi:quinol-cytochrome oxidoreductase complex cytochrome b subunit